MALSTDELGRTRSELRANLILTDLTNAQVATDLDWSPERLVAALQATTASDPVDVWQLRDYLELAIRDAGRSPVPFTVLTAGNRNLVRRWFRLRKVPRHDFANG